MNDRFGASLEVLRDILDVAAACIALKEEHSETLTPGSAAPGRIAYRYAPGSCCDGVLERMAPWQGAPLPGGADARQGVRAFYGLPLFSPEGRAAGVLAVVDDRERLFTPTETALVGQFAALAECRIADGPFRPDTASLISPICHQLKQPLNVLNLTAVSLSFAGIGGSVAPEELSTHLQRIQAQIGTLDRSIDAMRSFFVPSAATRFDGGDTVEALVALFASRFVKAGIVVELVRTAPLRLEGRQDRFMQLMQCLLFEAAESCAAGRIVCNVSGNGIHISGGDPHEGTPHRLEPLHALLDASGLNGTLAVSASAFVLTFPTLK